MASVKHKNASASAQCTPDEIALKSYFLGPKAENAPLVTELVNSILHDWFSWRQELYPADGPAITEADKKEPLFLDREERFRLFVADILHRFRAEIPTFTPRYIGHMVTEISLPALMGHIISLVHNPNNITGEASRVGVQLEDEAIQDLSKMIGYNPAESSGHFTSGGTVANFEGLLRARSRMARWLALGALARTQGENLSLFEAAHMGWDRYEQLYTKLRVTEDMIKPYHLLRTNPFDAARKLRGIFGCDYDGAVLLVPDNKHYSWEKAVRLIGLGDDAFWPVELDARGKLDVADLDRKIRKARQLQRPVLMVVSVAGTTEMGDFDPIDEVADLLDVFAAHDGINLWHHVDAAYGGFFCAINREETPELSGAMKKALAAIGRSQSLTVDPHKLGFVPYASGAFLCATTREYRAHHIQAPYLDLSRKEDKGPQTIEGSRSAAGAVSTWLTSKIIGLDGDGYGRILARTIRARIRVQELLKQSDTRFRIAPHGETNILCFCFARDYEPVSVTNRRTQQLYEHFSTRENRDFFVSRTTLTFGAYSKYLDGFLKEWNGQVDESGLTLIRITVLNPFFSSRETGVDYAQDFVNAVCAVLDRS